MDASKPYQISRSVADKGERVEFLQNVRSPIRLRRYAQERRPDLYISEEGARAAAKEFRAVDTKMAITAYATSLVTGATVVTTLGRKLKNKIAATGQKAGKKDIAKALGIGLEGGFAAFAALVVGALTVEKPLTLRAIKRANQIFINDAAKAARTQE